MMKKGLLTVALSALFLAGCQTAGNSIELEEVVATPQLEAAIKNFTNETAPKYAVAYADLNQDGIDDGLVLLEGEEWCGTGGCTLLVFEGLADGNYKLASKSTVANAPIYVLEARSNGWSDLSVYSKGKGQVVMKWGGSNYPSNPSLQPTLIIDSKAVKPAISGKIDIPD